MIIKDLHIHNIASIVDATVDFSRSPLSDTDVYLITGDTGAGKTTILDSICLALFNNTPRLAKGKLTKVKNDNDSLTLRDSRRLMRRNTGEADIVLHFGANGMDYEAEWHVQRGKQKKPAVGVDNVERRFTNLTKNETVTGIGTKDTELQAKIHEVIGLDFDQFCRTTMLAQNEFTKFLSSDENERATILEKITKTEEFSRAGKLVFEITSDKKKEWETAQKAASDSGLKDEEIKEKKLQIEELNKQVVQKKTERENARTKRDWLRQENNLLNEEAVAKSLLEEANKQIESEEYKNKYLFVEQWNKTIDARKWLVDKHNAEARIEKNRNDLEQQKACYVEVLSGVMYSKTELGTLEEELQQIDEYLKANSITIPTYENAQTIGAQLTTIITKRKNIVELQASIVEAEKNRNDNLLPRQQKTKDRFDEQEKIRLNLNNDIETKDKMYQSLDMKSLREESESIKELIHNIDSAVKALDDVKKVEDSRAQEELRLVAAKKTLDAKVKELNENIIPAFEKAKVDIEATKIAKDLLVNSVNSFAKQMRTHLSVGCKCPVCCQEVASLPVESEIDEAYEAADIRFKATEVAYKKAEAAKNAAEAQITIDSKRYEADIERLRADRSVADAKDSALALCKKCGIVSLSDNTYQELEAIKKDKAVILDSTIFPSIKKGDVLDAELRELRKGYSLQTSVCEKVKNDLDDIQNKIKECDSHIESSRKLIAECRKDEASAIESAGKLITEANWQYDWKKQPDMFYDELTDAVRTYNTRKNRQSELAVSINNARTEIEKIMDIIKSIYKTLPSWSGVSASVLYKKADLFNKANSVLQSLVAIMQSYREAADVVKTNSKALDDFLTQHPELSVERLKALDEVQSESVTTLAERLEAMRKEPGKKEELLKKTMSAHLEHKARMPELSDEDTVDSCDKACNDADYEMTSLSRQSAVIQKELEDDEVKKRNNTIMQQKEAETRKEYEKWERLNRLVGDADGKKFRTIAQSYIFGGLLNSANAYLQKLEPRYTLKTVEGTLFSSLEDAYQGFATRDTSSLSGGESFLVSLALALALSDIGQGLSVDTLFIDEGFGSLSGQPLANAINTLRSLHSKNGRHVGIISHIQEVRENIPVQIQVLKSANNSCSTIKPPYED